MTKRTSRETTTSFISPVSIVRRITPITQLSVCILQCSMQKYRWCLRSFGFTRLSTFLRLGTKVCSEWRGWGNLSLSQWNRTRRYVRDMQTFTSANRTTNFPFAVLERFQGERQSGYRTREQCAQRANFTRSARPWTSNRGDNAAFLPLNRKNGESETRSTSVSPISMCSNVHRYGGCATLRRSRCAGIVQKC